MSDTRPRREAVDTTDDEDGLERLYREHAGWLLAQLRRQFGAKLGGAAEDLVQETYARAAHVTARGPILRPRALLSRIAHRLALDSLRASRRERLGRLPADDVVLADQEAQLLLKDAILGLPRRQREALLLSRLDGLTYEEIAGRLGVSVKTVEVHISKALARCAAALRDA